MLGSATAQAGFILALSAGLCTAMAHIEARSGTASMTPNSRRKIEAITTMKPAWATFGNQRDDECPPCFNCMLPSFTCMQYGRCSEYDGQCVCPDGYGGQDCSKPLEGSLADGKERFPRQGNESHCKDGWTGLLCNGQLPTRGRGLSAYR